jgi:hypothetical protein
MPAPGASYAVRQSPLRPPVIWSLEDGALVRRGAGAQKTWPLATLTRLTLTRQANRYGPDIRLAQLRFGRAAVAFSSQTWVGVGHSEDQTRAFAVFVRDLAAQAAPLAPAARFQIGGRASIPGGLYWIAALLGAGVVALAAVALTAGEVALGLELGARLLFVLILLFAVAPWLPGAAANAFNPHDIPEGLAPRV